jgi:hypothetical protein
MLISMFAVSAFAADYTDVTGHWGESAIARWSDDGIVEGRGDGQFAPNATLTRAEAATIFVRLLGLDETDDSLNFGDVPADAWYTDAVYKCAAAGIVEGNGDGTYSPNANIRREDVFLMFARAMGIPDAEEMDHTFDDGSKIDSWAVGAVNALVNLGYIHGMSDSIMDPTASINRASIMTLLDNSISDYITEDGVAEVKGTAIVLIRAKNVTLTGNITGSIVVAEEGAKVDLSGVTGDVTVYVRDDDVEIVGAPVGTTVEAAEDVSGTEVNGKAVEAGASTEVTKTTSTSTGSTGSTGSAGGSSTPSGNGSNDAPTGNTTPGGGTGGTTPGENAGNTTPGGGTGGTTPGENTGNTTPGGGTGAGTGGGNTTDNNEANGST